jgi:hypothetical protein
VCDKRANGSKRSASVSTEEFVGATQEAITRGLRENVLPLSQQIGASATTAWKIYRDNFLLFPYKMHLGQPLSGDGIARDGIQSATGEQSVLNVTWFFDETQFHLDG